MSRDKFIDQGAPAKSRERRRQEATRWFVILQRANPSPRVLESWKKWVSIPENREAFDAVERMWRLTGTASDLPASTPDELAADKYDGSVSVAEWRSTHSDESSRLHKRTRFPLHIVSLAAAAALIVLGLMNFVPDYFSAISSHGRSVAIETGLAEHKEIVFEDGSRIQLGAQSAVTARFTRRTRSVVLDRGEALFSVAPDPKRPFTVNAGGGVITAVGTAFNVRRRENDEVVVTVTNGVVEIAPIAMEEFAPISPLSIPMLVLDRESRAARAEKARRDVGGWKDERPPAIRRLSRGQEVTYDAEGRLGAVRSLPTTASTEWSDGRLKYLGEPLRHVIEDINRYSRRKLVLEDAAAGTLLYSGTVFARDIDDWITGLKQIYPELEVVMMADGHIVIRTRATRDNAG